MGLKIGDKVKLPLDEEGIIINIITDRLAWFPFRVKITKATLSMLDQISSYKGEQLTLILKLYYIQDSRNYVGNSMLFWRKGNAGYTTDIDEAKICSEEEALKIYNNRETDIPWEKEYIDSKIKKHVDMQYCDKEESGIK